MTASGNSRRLPDTTFVRASTTISLASPGLVCHHRNMRAVTNTTLIAALILALSGPALAQSDVEIRTAPPPTPRFEIVTPGDATREVSRPREADFYREDIRVRHEPAFVEPFVGRTPGGNEYGLSGWTSPAPPVGSLASQGYQQTNGWFSFGLSFLFDYPPPKAAPRPASAPR
jgi:hypothetical protein